MLKNIVGGEIEEYTKLQAFAREQAIASHMASKVVKFIFFKKKSTLSL